MRHRLRVGIMGAGRIAQGFDNPGDARVLTLAHAVKLSKRLLLGGFFDSRVERARAAEGKWDCPPSPRDRTAWLASGWDVVFVATPDASHHRDLADVLQMAPRAVLVEKPLAENGAVARRLLKTARRLGIALYVDFPRRQHPGIRSLEQRLSTGSLGRIRELRAVYSGGLEHNGFHLLDIIAAWCGRVKSVRLIARRGSRSWLRLSVAGGFVDLFLTEAPQRDCYVWELTCDTDRARLELRGAPETLSLYGPAPHPIFGGFTSLRLCRSWSVDDEPLLLGVVERVARLAANSQAARAHLDLELERQRFFDRVAARLAP